MVVVYRDGAWYPEISRDAHGTISGRLRTPSWDTVLPSGGTEAPSWDATIRSRDGTPPSREARDTILGRPRHHLGTVCHDLETPVHTILARSVAISRRRGTISGHHATVSGRDATIWGEADANLRTTQRPSRRPPLKRKTSRNRRVSLSRDEHTSISPDGSSPSQETPSREPSRDGKNLTALRPEMLKHPSREGVYRDTELRPGTVQMSA